MDNSAEDDGEATTGINHHQQRREDNHHRRSSRNGGTSAPTAANNANNPPLATTDSHEVQVVPQFRLQDRIQKFEEHSKPKPQPLTAAATGKSRKTPAVAALAAHSAHISSVKIGGSSRGAGNKRAAAGGPSATSAGRPTYAASARKVLMSSARGLLRLQSSLAASMSSLYVNDMFEDGAPCQVTGCPLNPDTRVREHHQAGDAVVRSSYSSC